MELKASAFFFKYAVSLRYVGRSHCHVRLTSTTICVVGWPVVRRFKIKSIAPSGSEESYGEIRSPCLQQRQAGHCGCRARLNELTETQNQLRVRVYENSYFPDSGPPLNHFRAPDPSLVELPVFRGINNRSIFSFT